MASTDQVREWYSETILNHDQRGTSGYEPQCDWRSAVIVEFPNQSGGHYSEPVHPATADAWKIYVRLMEHHGVEMSGAGGVNQCRNIAGTNWPSLHAYLVACDLPPNSYKPQAFIDDVLRVRSNNGKQVFLNGAIFNDRMHDQINCSQSDLATGIDPTSLPFQEDDMPDPRISDPEARTLAKIHAMFDEKRADVNNIQAKLIDIARNYPKTPSSGGGGLSEAQVKALINDSQIVAPD